MITKVYGYRTKMGAIVGVFWEQMYSGRAKPRSKKGRVVVSQDLNGLAAFKALCLRS